MSAGAGASGGPGPYSGRWNDGRHGEDGLARAGTATQRRTENDRPSRMRLHLVLDRLGRVAGADEVPVQRVHRPGRVDGTPGRDQGLARDLPAEDPLRPDRRAHRPRTGRRRARRRSSSRTTSVSRPAGLVRRHRRGSRSRRGNLADGSAACSSSQACWPGCPRRPPRRSPARPRPSPSMAWSTWRNMASVCST